MYFNWMMIDSPKLGRCTDWSEFGKYFEGKVKPQHFVKNLSFYFFHAALRLSLFKSIQLVQKRSSKVENVLCWFVWDIQHMTHASLIWKWMFVVNDGCRACNNIVPFTIFWIWGTKLNWILTSLSTINWTSGTNIFIKWSTTKLVALTNRIFYERGNLSATQ